MSKWLKRNVICSAIVLLGICLDQIVKYVTVNNVALGQKIPFWEGFVHFTYRQNTGAAFSLLEGHPEFFSVFTVIVLLMVAFVLYSGSVTNGVCFYSLACIFCGGVGNLIDRLTLGYVVDMIDARFLKIPYLSFSPFSLTWGDFAIFNVADMFITLGTIVFIIAFIFKKGEVISWNLPFPKNKQDSESTKP